MPAYERPRFMIGSFADASSICGCVSALFQRGAGPQSLYVLAGTAAGRAEFESKLQGLSVGLPESSKPEDPYEAAILDYAVWLDRNASEMFARRLADSGFVMFALALDADQQLYFFKIMRGRVSDPITIQDAPALFRAVG